jgi:hypothetical protein
MELVILLNTGLKMMISCVFLNIGYQKKKIRSLNIEHYSLADKFIRINGNHGESCIFVHEEIQVKEARYLQALTAKKGFEISVIEVVDYKCILACI